MTDLATQRADRDLLVFELEQAGAKPGRKANMFCCPWHHDENPSLSVYQDTDGAWKFKCHGCDIGGDVFDVIAKASGKALESVLRDFGGKTDTRLDSTQQKPATSRETRFFANSEAVAQTYSTLEASFQYSDPETKRLDLLVIRYRATNGKKVFAQYHTTSRGITPGAPEKPWPIYNRARVKQSPKVVVCYSSDTEILTECGWTPFPSLSTNQSVAQWNIQTEEIIFKRPIAVQVFDFDGQLAHFKSDWCDLLVTPDHRMAWKRKGCRKKVWRADDLHGYGIWFPVSGKYDGDRPQLTVPQIQLLAAFQNDGCDVHNRGYNSSIFTWNLKKLRKIERLRRLLNECGIGFTEQEFNSTPGWRLFTIRKAHAKWLYKPMSPGMILWDLCSKNTFLDELQYWDGDSCTNNSMRFFTAKKIEADVISAMAATSGWGVIQRLDPRRGRENYVVNLKRNTTWRSFLNIPSNNLIEYSGKVFCCTTETGFVIIRRNGKVTIAGNCEGEKCVHALHDIGLIATTSPCGAGKAEYADWTLLAGKSVWLWPDYDVNGLAHMNDVAKILEKLKPRPRLYWIDPKVLCLSEKQDVVDFLAQNAEDTTVEQKRILIEQVMDAAEPLGASRELGDLLEDTIAGRRKAIKWPWSLLSRLGRALLPGTVTLLCGDPGATKSFVLMQSLMFWCDAGEEVAVYELEDTRADHMLRALTQRIGDGKLLDTEWVAVNAQQVRAYHDEQAEYMDGFGASIWQAPDGVAKLDTVAAWVEDRAREGRRIIAVDPITAADPGKDVWVGDLNFIMRCKKAISKSKSSLILITHPKKGKQGIGLDDLAGGAAYQRLSQTVIWIEWHDEILHGSFCDAGGVYEHDYNRTFHLRKTRNGPGQGTKLGYFFDRQTMRMQEVGVLRKDGKKGNK